MPNTGEFLFAKWKIEFKPGWDKHFQDFDKEVKERILKKIDKMEEPLPERGLVSSRYCVEEVGQCRIAYIKSEADRVKKIHFIGNHKQYERWYSHLE